MRKSIVVFGVCCVFFSSKALSSLSMQYIAPEAKPSSHADTIQPDQIAPVNKLVLSGSTTRKLFFFDIYKISHYVEWPYESPQSKQATLSLIENANVQQRVELTFLRDVSRRQIEEALIDGIERNNTDKDLMSIKTEIQRLSKGFDDDVEKHSVLALSRASKAQLKVSFNDDVIVETQNADLADALWSIWFGKDPIVDTEALIKNLIKE
ncbi:chalcone isomerase family protein [Alteromonas gracilis]|uniref:chalcone isomerase family protein n=1 Tax=Alteromonas gracilis TaxID=1479524 RepID=UPI0030D2AEBB